MTWARYISSQRDAWNQLKVDRFLPYEARAEICQNLVGFLGDVKTPKFHSEIKWPLVYFVVRDRHSSKSFGTISVHCTAFNVIIFVCGQDGGPCFHFPGLNKIVVGEYNTNHVDPSCLITLIHYLENKLGVVDFANAQLVMFKAQGIARSCELWNFTTLRAFKKSTTPTLFSR